jgi:flagellar assembly protein FliH
VEKNTCKVISGDTPAAECRPWAIPEVAIAGLRAGGERDAGGVMLTAGRIEELQQQARQEAFELGRREGLERGRAEAAGEVERLGSILKLLEAPLQALDERLVEEVTALAVAIARHVVRREIRSDPGQIVGVVRQAAGILPVAARRVRLYLNPEDATTVRETMKLSPGHDGTWELIEDPAISRGGCRVETESSRIDATIEKRLATIAAGMLGGDRERDHDSESV